MNELCDSPNHHDSSRFLLRHSHHFLCYLLSLLPRHRSDSHHTRLLLRLADRRMVCVFSLLEIECVDAGDYSRRIDYYSSLNFHVVVDVDFVIVLQLN